MTRAFDGVASTLVSTRDNVDCVNGFLVDRASTDAKDQR